MRIVTQATTPLETNNFKVYASPYQPEFCDFAFPYFRDEDRFNPSHQCTPNAKPIAENPVPDFPDIDIMMTHGPPMGVMDTIITGKHVGCEHLLRAARRCKPKLHCFGHIHEGWGAQKVRWNNDGQLDVNIEEHIEAVDTVPVDEEATREKRAATVDIGRNSDTAIEFGKETLMVNASIMNVRYKPWNAPWLVDLDLECAQ
jgi:hypothetical protein